MSLSIARRGAQAAARRRSGSTPPSASVVGEGSWYDPQVQSAGLSNFSAITPDAGNGGPGTAVVVMDDPLGVLLTGTSDVRKVIRFKVTESTGTYVTGNPRAQVEGGVILNTTDRSDVFFGFSMMFPTNSGGLTGTFFPDELPPASSVGHNPGDHFFTFAEVYGPPYNGGSPWKLTMGNDDTIIFQPPASALGSYQKVWRLPPGAQIPRNQWLDFVWHEKLSTNPAVGFAEVWLNTGAGYEKLVFTDGSTKLFLATLDSTNWNGGPNQFKLASYRGSRMHGDAVDATYTHYVVAQRYGPTFASVDPSTYGPPVTTPPSPAPNPPSAWGFVKGNGATSSTPKFSGLAAAAPITLTGVTAGDMLVLAVGCITDGTTFTVADSAGNAWNTTNRVQQASGADYAQIWWSPNVAAGDVTVTITRSGGSFSYFHTYLAEYSGGGATPTLRTSAGRVSPSGTSHSSGTTPASAVVGDLVLGVLFDSSATRAPTPSDGKTSRASTGAEMSTAFSENLATAAVAQSAAFTTVGADTAAVLCVVIGVS